MRLRTEPEWQAATHSRMKGAFYEERAAGSGQRAITAIYPSVQKANRVYRKEGQLERPPSLGEKRECIIETRSTEGLTMPRVRRRGKLYFRYRRKPERHTFIKNTRKFEVRKRNGQEGRRRSASDNHVTRNAMARQGAWECGERDGAALKKTR